MDHNLYAVSVMDQQPSYLVSCDGVTLAFMQIERLYHSPRRFAPVIHECGIQRKTDRRASRTMIKLVYCITKNAGMSDEEFFRYWQNVHGPIGARIPGLRRLVQSHRRIIPGDKRSPDYDGMAELWFDDVEGLLAARQSPEWKSSADDETNFIDHRKVAYFVSEEQIIVDSPK